MAQTRAVPEKDDPRVTGLRFAKVLVWLVYAYFIVALIILTLAFFLLLFNASATASFTQWVYRSANRVLEPFRGIFPTKSLGDSGSVIDFAVVFAIIMYGIFALVVHAVVNWLDGRIVELRASIEAARRAAAQQQAAATPDQVQGTWSEPGLPTGAGTGSQPGTGTGSRTGTGTAPGTPGGTGTPMPDTPPTGGAAGPPPGSAR